MTTKRANVTCLLIILAISAVCFLAFVALMNSVEPPPRQDPEVMATLEARFTEDELKDIWKQHADALREASEATQADEETRQRFGLSEDELSNLILEGAFNSWPME